MADRGRLRTGGARDGRAARRARSRRLDAPAADASAGPTRCRASCWRSGPAWRSWSPPRSASGCSRPPSRIVERYRDARRRSRPAAEPSRLEPNQRWRARPDAPVDASRASSRRFRPAFSISRSFVCLDGAGEFDQVHVRSLAPRTCQLPSCIDGPKKPLDRSTSPNIRAVSGDSIVLQLFFSCAAVSDHRPVRIAGSAAARHPAGGSTRRRSKVSLSGGPFRAGDNVGAAHARHHSASVMKSTWTSVHAESRHGHDRAVHSDDGRARSKARSSGQPQRALPRGRAADRAGHPRAR